MRFANMPRWTDPRLQTRARFVARCAQKQRHASEGAAHAHLRALAKGDFVPAADVARLVPYPCPFCHGWHVGRPKV